MEKLIRSELDNKNVKKIKEIFYINDKETDIDVLILILKYNPKLSKLSDEKLKELILKNYDEKELFVSDSNISEHRDNFTLDIKNTKILPVENDKFLEDIFVCKTIDGNVVYHVKKDNTFNIIAKTSSGKYLIKETMEYCGMHEKFYRLFEDTLHGWSVEITKIYNNSGNEAAKEYIEKEIPPIFLKNFDVKVFYTEKNINQKKVTTYEYVDFLKNGKRITYADYLEEIFETFGTMSVKEISEPQIYTNDPNTPAYHFFDITPFQKEEKDDLSEAWEEVFSKFTEDEKNIILAHTWAIFDAKNKTRASLYFADLDGYSGKSAMSDAICQMIGLQNVGVLQKDSLTNQFGFAKIWDKRFILFPDSKNNNIIRSEKIHILLGGDMADVEYKGQQSFSKKLNSKIWINSNIMPDFDGDQVHEDSRVIIVKPKMSEKVLNKIALKDENGNFVKDEYGKYTFIGDSTFGSKLTSTSASFLVNCYQSYKKLCPHDADFIVPKSIRDNNRNIKPVEIIIFDSIFDSIFEISGNSETEAETVLKLYNTFCTNNQEYSQYKTNQQYGEFLKYLEKSKKVTKMRKRVGDIRKNIFVGIKEKNNISEILDMLKNDKFGGIK